MLPDYNKMSSNNDNANNNNNNNAASSSLTVIAQQSKNMLSAILPERVPSALSITASPNNTNNNVEGRNTKITPTNSDDCPREGILDSTSSNNNGTTTTSSSNNITYQSIRYAHLLTPSTTNTTTATTMANYTTLTSRHRTGRRCYRLNLERPFNIHCEQSPLEYGDIFAPWDKSVRPVTYGPSEYCPPRHLGGGEEIWRRLMSFGRYGNEGGNNNNGGPNNKGDDNYNKDGINGGGMEGGMNLGWRKLTPHEVSSVERLGETNPQGEYSFSTYDLTHVKPRMKKQQQLQQQQQQGGGQPQEGKEQGGGTNFREITPSTSIDSTSSDSSDSNPKSALLKANETARLFRRSELSLRLKAEEEAQKHAAELAQRNAERNEREQAELNELKKIKGAKGISRRLSKKASLNGKKMLRKLSSSFGTSTSSGSSTSRMMNYNGGIYEGGMGPHSSSRRRLVSTQAGMIEKAKDVIDEESEDEYDGEKYDDTKKIKNMSLFIVGEYDVLNDLCLDGGKRLKASQHLSDLDLLLQNDPCPPPNRWVRKTGWGKCNPSSMYAECPPKDFDWEKYLKKDGPVPVNPVPRPVMQVKS